MHIVLNPYYPLLTTSRPLQQHSQRVGLDTLLSKIMLKLNMNWPNSIIRDWAYLNQPEKRKNVMKQRQIKAI
jgi:hypothetical protein